MDSLPEDDRQAFERAELSSLLDESRKLLSGRQFRRAAIHYRILLREPALPADPAAQREAMANLGTAILCQVMDGKGVPDAARALRESINVFRRARRAHFGAGATPPFHVDTNLALAHHQMFLHTDDASHLMAAHLLLDTVKPPKEHGAEERLAAIRRMLMDAAGHNRQ